MARTNFPLFVFALFSTTVHQLVTGTPFTSCSPPADPIDLRFEGCTVAPCVIVRGENAAAEWDFEVTADTQVLTPRATGTILGLSIPYDIGQSNACETLTNAECPLDKGERITYALSLPVASWYPTLTLPVEFALLGDDGKVQVCFKVSVRVT